MACFVKSKVEILPVRVYFVRNYCWCYVKGHDRMCGELLTCQLIHSLVNKLLTSEKISEYLLEIMQQEVLDTAIVCKFLYIGHKYAIQ